MRVFHDRLINVEDKSYFYFLMKEVCLRYFSNSVLPLPDTPIITNPPLLLFGDFMVPSAEFRIYEEIKDIGKLKSILKVKFKLENNICAPLIDINFLN